ncbi:MAG: NYN domain-containing protein [Chloroflexota bacterium]
MIACIFVDGESFRHSIVDLFPQFRQEDYLPKSANWTNLFDWIIKNVVEGGERLRTYWYVIKSLDFFPYYFPDLTKTENPKKAEKALYRLLSKYEPYQKDLDKLDPKDFATRMQEIVEELKERKNIMRSRFDGWVAIQNGISREHKAIEFRRAGAMTYNLFDKSLGAEKAVDVKLSCDMIMLRDIYDIAIIVSGDQDYVPAVEVLKDCGKRVVNVAFKTRAGQLLPGGARRLNQVTDWSFNIEFIPLAEYLQIGQLPLE